MKRLLFLMLMLFSLMTLGYSLNDSILYYSFDDDDTTGTNMFDLSGNNHTGTCLNMASNCNSGIGIIKNSTYFDGVDDTVATHFKPNTNNFSISFWVNPNTNNQLEGYMTTLEQDGTRNGFYIGKNTDNTISSAFYLNQIPQVIVSTTNTISAGTWNNIVLRYNNGNLLLYLNGVFENSQSGTVITLQEYNLSLGEWFQNYAGREYNGYIDEVSIWDRQLSMGEITQLYNNGTGYNPYSNITGTPPTVPLIESDIKPYYDNENITINLTINLTSSQNVNMSYILDNGNETLLCLNCNQTTVNFFNLTEKEYNVSWISKIGNENSTVDETFLIDYTNPNLSVLLPNEYNYYQGFNFSKYISYSDINLDSCIVTISEEISTNCNDENYTFNLNGNHNINITVTDLAGNINSSLNNILLINPYQYFSFKINNSFISNYTFSNKFSSNKIINFTTYNEGLNLGNNSGIFSKFGYNTQGFNFILNRTSKLNNTYNLTQAYINLTIFDRETRNKITSLVKIQLVSTLGFNTTTTTGNIFVNDFDLLNESYIIIINSQNYQPETLFFNFNNQEILTLEAYLIKSNSSNLGTHKVRIEDQFGSLLSNVLVKLLEWNPSTSSYITTSQIKTNLQGEADFNLELGQKLYKFLAINIDNQQKESTANIISTTGLTTTITLDPTEIAIKNYLGNLAYTFDNTSINSTHQIINLTVTDLDGLVTKNCIDVYDLRGAQRTLLQEVCSSSSSTILFTSPFNINKTNDVLVQAITYYNNKYFVLDEKIFKGTLGISKQLDNLGFLILVPLVLIIGSIGIGFLSGNIYIGIILVTISSWFSSIFATQYMPTEISAVITILAGLTLWGGYKR